ncbi:MAG: CRTAC1 family protein [Candidatus Acidiferrales bacterium]
MRKVAFSLVLAAYCVAQGTPQAHSSKPALRFEDVAKQAGLTVPHISSPEKKYIVESMSGGVGFIDCDGDGKLDIVTVNGSNVERFLGGGDPLVTLYHQDANLKFSDITKAAGLTKRGWGMGVAVADFDNDGLPDLFVTGFDGNVLYRNKGNCRFEDVTQKAGLDAKGFNAGAAWGDFDRDGNVDLFVARYVKLDIHHLPEFGSKADSCTILGMKVQCGPLGLPGESNLFYRSKGDGTFEEISKKAGVDNPGGSYGMQPIWFDYDNDGWPDLFVANDAGPNYLYRNRRDGTFEDVSLLSGTAVDANGKAKGSMGVDVADFLHTGWLSLFVTEYNFQSDTLFLNEGPKEFTDITGGSGIAQPTYPYVGWGTAFVDVDNDGWSDIFVANGHVFPQADNVKGLAPYREPVFLFRNNRDKTFEDVTAISGLNELPILSRRGAAFGDVNNDGKIDILILNMDGPPTLLINRSESVNHSATFRLIGTKSNASAIGARVRVTAGNLVQFDEVRGGGSYLSQNDPRLHFGLESHAMMDRVEVSWPSGSTEEFPALPVDFIYTITEGKGITQKTAFNTAKAPPLIAQ